MNNSESLNVNYVPGETNFDGKKTSPDAITIDHTNINPQDQNKQTNKSEKNIIKPNNEEWQKALEIIATDKATKLLKFGKKALLIFALSVGIGGALNAAAEKGKGGLPKLQQQVWEEKMRHDLYDEDVVLGDNTVTMTEKVGDEERTYVLDDSEKDGYPNKAWAHTNKAGIGSVEIETDGYGFHPKGAKIKLDEKLDEAQREND